jgi:hypothetical protein
VIRIAEEKNPSFLYIIFSLSFLLLLRLRGARTREKARKQSEESRDVFVFFFAFSLRTIFNARGCKQAQFCRKKSQSAKKDTTASILCLGIYT